MQSILNFLMGHQAIIAALLIAIIDCLFALSPGLQSNGILHAVYLYLKSMNDKAPPAAPAT